MPAAAVAVVGVAAAAADKQVAAGSSVRLPDPDFLICCFRCLARQGLGTWRWRKRRRRPYWKS